MATKEVSDWGLSGHLLILPEPEEVGATQCEFCDSDLPDPLTWCCSVRIDRLLAQALIDEEGLGMFRLHPDIEVFTY